MEHDTNLIQKVELKGKDVYFDGVKQVFNSHAFVTVLLAQISKPVS